MKKELLEIKDLHVSVADKEILNGINLKINCGETHVIMGTNGAGKSTLMNAIMANPIYEVTSGDIYYKGKSIKEDSTDERARNGIFMSFQQAYEIPGLTLENFLRGAKSAVLGKPVSIIKFKKELRAAMAELGMDESYAGRYLNVGFSGGEKKKSEILQMKILEPSLALLDETDSGLDVDAVKIVASGIKSWQSKDRATIIITHHQELLNQINPDFVHVLSEGKILETGDISLAQLISKEGYAWTAKEA